jgi:hypothetical protein
MTKLERMGVVATGPLQLLLTPASMVGCINAIVGGAVRGAQPGHPWVADRVTRPHGQPVGHDVDTGPNLQPHCH